MGNSREILTNKLSDQLELPNKAFNCLNQAEIQSINNLLKYGRDDLLKLNWC